jgi:hypothetical protein
VRFDRTVIVGAVLAAVVWIEHGHRIDIGTPSAAAFSAALAARCPDNENVPYSSDCIVFMQGETGSDVRPRAIVPRSVSGTASQVVASMQPPNGWCPPHNENAPYSANCLQFLSGWYWHANAGERPTRHSDTPR